MRQLGKIVFVGLAFALFFVLALNRPSETRTLYVGGVCMAGRCK